MNPVISALAGRARPRRMLTRARLPLKWAVIAAIVVILAAAGVTGHLPRPGSSWLNYVALPFTGLNRPVGVAVDTAGDVYVADLLNDRVVKLAAGSRTQ